MSLTKAQAEANWVWDPKRGDIPFKRPRITDENIRAQRKLASPGTLMHWVGMPCTRAKAQTDGPLTAEQAGEYMRKHNLKVGHMCAASHIENVNCLACRRRFYRRRK